MPSSTYEVVSAQVTIQLDNGNLGLQQFRLTAPSGKKPLSGGFRTSFTPGSWPVHIASSYPDGQDWVFEFIGEATASHVATIYLTAAIVV
jgi:hypothetical protein